MFATIVELRWRYMLFALLVSFMVSWLLFALLWWSMALLHGDYEEDNLEKMKNGTFVPCLTGNKNFVSAFLFSVETHQTIGYGFRQPTEKCYAAIILQWLQCSYSIIFHAAMTGIVFSKIARPKGSF